MLADSRWDETIAEGFSGRGFKSVELFRSTNIDWLGKKWYFLGFSLIFSVAGVLSMLFWHHIPKGWTLRVARISVWHLPDAE